MSTLLQVLVILMAVLVSSLGRSCVFRSLKLAVKDVGFVCDCM